MPAYFTDPAALAPVAPAPDAWLLAARTARGALWLRPRYAAGGGEAGGQLGHDESIASPAAAAKWGRA